MKILFTVAALLLAMPISITDSNASEYNIHTYKMKYDACIIVKDLPCALELAQKHADNLKSLLGSADDQYLTALALIAKLHAEQYNYKESIDAYKLALSEAESVDRYSVLTGEIIKRLALLYKTIGNADGLEFFTKYYEVFQAKKRGFEERETTEGEVANENYNTNNFRVVPVFYATDRLGDLTNNLKSRYGASYSRKKRGGYLDYGVAKVSIPADDKHRIGRLESPSLLRFEWSEDPSKHVVLLDIEVKKAANFFGALKKKVLSSDNKNAFIFIHGYNVTFEDAARRTAQIAYDLEFKGAPVLYSWPSQGTTFGYTADFAAIEWTEPHLLQFLEDFLKHSSADNIFLIAHSMGNRAITRILSQLAVKDISAKSRIQEIILAAPDIDADVFKDNIAPRIVGTYKNVTLYSSSNDLALLASKLFHGDRVRLGNAISEINVIPGIETIDASEIQSEMFGHSYVSSSSPLINDLIQLFTYRRRAKDRDGLTKRSLKNSSYWSLNRSE